MKKGSDKVRETIFGIKDSVVEKISDGFKCVNIYIKEKDSRGRLRPGPIGVMESPLIDLRTIWQKNFMGYCFWEVAAAVLYWMDEDFCFTVPVVDGATIYETSRRMNIGLKGKGCRLMSETGIITKIGKFTYFYYADKSEMVDPQAGRDGVGKSKFRLSHGERVSRVLRETMGRRQVVAAAIEEKVGLNRKKITQVLRLMEDRGMFRRVSRGVYEPVKAFKTVEEGVKYYIDQGKNKKGPEPTVRSNISKAMEEARAAADESMVDRNEEKKEFDRRVDESRRAQQMKITSGKVTYEEIGRGIEALLFRIRKERDSFQKDYFDCLNRIKELNEKVRRLSAALEKKTNGVVDLSKF